MGAARAVLARTWRVLALVLPTAAGAAGQGEPDAERQRALVRVVRQDCGACHGMRLTGGLGPALTPQALADKPFEGLVATIVHGRPGTPMPGWRSMLSEADAVWITQLLQQGFPEESPKDRP
ncbi:cytochrome c [Ideonella sp. A 288]|uniref:c-type cytochrome n=1 Tax=Ideonella sp. A 288 TaxID=1962181 RepID=UPI000B4BD332|nr:cytochrome c [Ideonella sp. A 288]